MPAHSHPYFIAEQIDASYILYSKRTLKTSNMVKRTNQLFVVFGNQAVQREVAENEELELASVLIASVPQQNIEIIDEEGDEEEEEFGKSSQQKSIWIV